LKKYVATLPAVVAPFFLEKERARKKDVFLKKVYTDKKY